jgi:DNA-binding MarR family transcriptional regulator
MVAKRDGRIAAGHLAFLLAQIGGLAALRFAERIEPLRLTPAHAGLLRAVAAAPGRSQQALSAQLGLLPSKLVALVDELEGDQLLERRRNPVDRRNYALHTTPAGDARLAEIGRIAKAHGDDLLAPLDEQDRADLARILGQLAAHHQLTPGVHPGYRALGRPAAVTGPGNHGSPRKSSRGSN